MAITPNARIGTAGELWRGDPGYEDVRLGAVWNARKPQRFPDVIVRAVSEVDVIKAVGYAHSHGLKVGIRSGGHSVCANGIRDGGMLIDLSRLRDVSIDPNAAAAAVQPSITAREFACALGERGLAFPVGHCGSVALGGYLLAGGFGWNMGVWGPACFSVRAIEVVMADGTLVRADAEHNSDLFWAARGAGSGFFGVVTRFHLDVYPAPQMIMTSMAVYALAEVEAIGRWTASIAPLLPPTVEMILALVSAPPGAAVGPSGKAVLVSATAFQDSEDEAARSLSLLKECPSAERALMRRDNQRASFEALHDLIGTFLPDGHRFAEDTIWSNESLAELLPLFAEHVVGAPSAKSLVLAPVIRPPRDSRAFPDAAFSMGGRSYVLSYAVWEDETEDEGNETWLRGMVESVAPFTIGHYIAENDLLADPSRASKSYAPANFARLQALRTKYDPDGVFHTYLGLET